MGVEKKYFWLRLKDDFFTEKEIKKLRRIAGGDTFTIIYLKMQLLSIKQEGWLLFDGTEESLEDQLALELDEDLENVKMTLAFLLANKLLEIESDGILLNRVPGLIGKESAAAERMRNMRIRNNVTPECNEVTDERNNVTAMLQPVTPPLRSRYADVRQCYTEIEIEKEIEIKDTTSPEPGDEGFESITKEKAEVITLWNQVVTSTQIKSINGNRMKMLKGRIGEHGLDGVLQAIQTIPASKFLNGQNDRGWIIDFDWFVKPNNFIKVLEGKYTDKRGAIKADRPKNAFHNFEGRLTQMSEDELNAMIKKRWEAKS